MKIKSITAAGLDVSPRPTTKPRVPEVKTPGFVSPMARYPDIAAVAEPDRPGIVHRLDKDTSGLLVVARTDANSAHLLTSDCDPCDREFITGERTVEGFYRMRGGLDAQKVYLAPTGAAECDRQCGDELSTVRCARSAAFLDCAGREAGSKDSAPNGRISTCAASTASACSPSCSRSQPGSRTPRPARRQWDRARSRRRRARRHRISWRGALCCRVGRAN